jgi:CRP/FNR family transcriptional regulator, cyclic AMP receptor protein
VAEERAPEEGPVGGPGKSDATRGAAVPHRDLALRRAALATVPLFKPLSAAEIDQILGHTALQRRPRGTQILRKGDPRSSMIVILQGAVRISALSADGREVSYAVLGAGEILGEISLLDGAERSADVTAIEDCVLLIVERAGFLGLIRKNPDLSLKLMGELCRRLRRSNLAVENLALLDLPSRIGKLLLGLPQVAGSAGHRVTIRLSQSDLATLAGGSREKINRQLRLWEKEGVIARDRGHIVILQPESLASPDLRETDRRSSIHLR